MDEVAPVPPDSHELYHYRLVTSPWTFFVVQGYVGGAWKTTTWDLADESNVLELGDLVGDRTVFADATLRRLERA